MEFIKKLGFKVIDHKADVSIEIKGRSIKELFIEGLKGLCKIVFEFKKEKIKTKERNFVKIEIEGIDLEDLLVRWLNEFIFYIFSKKLIPLRVKSLKIKDNKLLAEVYMSHFDPEKIKPSLELKAATYHGIKIESKNGVFITKIVFDI